MNTEKTDGVNSVRLAYYVRLYMFDFGFEKHNIIFIQSLKQTANNV